MTKELHKLRKKIRDEFGGRDSQREEHDLIRKNFIEDLFFAHDEGKAILPEKLFKRLEVIVAFDWLEKPLPPGRGKEYNDDEKQAFVKLATEYYDSGLTMVKACFKAAEDLFDSHRRPNRGTYDRWKKEFGLPDAKRKRRR